MDWLLLVIVWDEAIIGKMHMVADSSLCPNKLNDTNMRMAKLCISWICLGLILISAKNSISAATLSPIQASWHYLKGTNEASTPLNGWRQVGFNDGKWTTGAAPFHYGEGLTGGTVLTDMRNRYSSLFLRREFLLSNAQEIPELELRAICDDGFIAWINGIEVARYNVPAGDRTYNTFASISVSEPISYATYKISSPTYLQNGVNVIAVQLFNNSLTSSDLRWDAELISLEPDFVPPRIVLLVPQPGTVESLTQIAVTFSEPVTGVLASSLLMRGQSAISISGSNSQYVFFFNQPETGTVDLRWDADAAITDMAAPPNRFDPAAAGIQYYKVVDYTAPMISDFTPRSGSTVKSLSQIEIRFSERVAGVDASDLLINGVPATHVDADPSGFYRFQLTEPAPGMVQISWALNHGIQDYAEPANAFKGGSWNLTLDPNYVPPSLRINEFLAENVASNGLKDEDGELQDWIEIQNTSQVAVNLDGWSLTDSAEDPGRWLFPAITVNPGSYIIVYASGKDRRPSGTGGRLHANFKLNPAGEYLALFNGDSPRAFISGFASKYPEQRTDYSFGFDSDGQLRYFRSPTPGAGNGTSSITGVVEPPHVNISRGWFEVPFELFISVTDPSSTVRYTTDGSVPTDTHGAIYKDPLRIANTTVLRTAAFQANRLPSSVVTHTYLFLKDVLNQPNNPPGFPVGPTVMGGYPSDYEMDPEVVTNSLYSGILKDALLSLPVISLVCPVDDMFGAANGLYTHTTSRGPSWERACSAEFMQLSGGQGFQVNAGVQIQGNANREPVKQPKHAFRLVFKGDYGPRQLDFKMFPDSPVEHFDTLILRADFNFSWLHWNPNQRIRGQRTRDAWMKDSMRAMGGLASHNRYAHLFINGLYWGVYDPTERPDGSFGAAYLGGEKEEYDVMNEGAAVDGNNQAYNEMLGLQDLSSSSSYARMQQYLDITHYIDYMLLHFYVGHTDWGLNKNWYAIRPKNGRNGFFYMPWDGEMILDDPGYNRVTSSDTPSGLHSKLTANAEYRLAFADRARKHLFPGGALTPEGTSSRWMKRARQVELAIVAESARWGDYRRDVHSYQSPPYLFYTRDDQWRSEQKRLMNEYFPNRTATLLNQLRAAGLYPNVAAPDLNQNGGTVRRGFAATLSAPQGSIYWTVNGTDPRIPVTGAAASSASIYSGPVALTNSVLLKARSLYQGTWSAMTEAEFLVDSATAPLRIIEIMYHPIGGDMFEYLEIHNPGTIDIDLSGYSLGGVEYVFPYRSVLAAGRSMVLASALSPAMFKLRYPGVTVSGYFQGTLANSGEQLELRDREGAVLTAVLYGDKHPWPEAADGDGFSMELVAFSGNPSDPTAWQASAQLYGTPGVAASSILHSAVRMNEISAQDGLASTGDWVEIINDMETPASMDGWTLRDSENNSWEIPVGTSIQAHGFLVIYCDGQTNDAGIHAPFNLNKEGDSIFLYDANKRRVDAISFGRQVKGYSIGRIDNTQWILTMPTPGAANESASVANSARIKINEWMANPRPGGEDWLELYNSDLNRVADLTGFSLTGNHGAFAISAFNFIPPGGFLTWKTSANSDASRLGIQLPAQGGSITLLDGQGQVVDQVSFDAQIQGESQGRLPDGASSTQSFPGTASPGQSNGQLGMQTLLINEFMTSSRQGSGWIEIRNLSNDAQELGEFSLSFEGNYQWHFPAGARLEAEGYLKVYCDSQKTISITNADNLNCGHDLDNKDGEIALVDGYGKLWDSIQYGFMIEGRSVGRINQQWHLLDTPTPGQINSGAVLLGSKDQLKINEWFAFSPGGNDFIEIYNPSQLPVSLTGLQLTDDPSLIGGNRYSVGALSFIAPQGWVAWLADGNTDKGENHLNFNLDQWGESIRLYSPTGQLIDSVDYGTQSIGISMGRLADGGDSIGALGIGPTPGASNIQDPSSLDTDGDGMPDVWEKSFGTDPLMSNAMADPDHDGLANGQEYLAGTDPLDAASSLRINRIEITSAGVQLEFTVRADRTYSVIFTEDLANSIWRKLIDVPVSKTIHLETVTVPAQLYRFQYFRLVTPALKEN